MADTLTTTQSCNNVARIMENLAPLIVAETYVDGAAAFNDVLYDALLAATPEQDENKSGGYYKEAGDLRNALDSGIELDSALRGVHSGVGYGNRTFIARLVDSGHQMVHNGEIVGAAKPIPFLRQTIDGPAIDEGIAAFAAVLERKLPNVKP